MISWFFLLSGILAQAQYLPNEPAVGPFLEGIRYCVMEPMRGAQSLNGLSWLKQVKSGDEICVQNAAKLSDGNDSWIIFENSAGQVRAQKVSGPVDAEVCAQIRAGMNGADFNFRGLAERVARQKKIILLESEAAGPARTDQQLLQFALCHGALNKLIEQHRLRGVLTGSESERLNRVHRPSEVRPLGGGAGR